MRKDPNPNRDGRHLSTTMLRLVAVRETEPSDRPLDVWHTLIVIRSRHLPLHIHGLPNLLASPRLKLLIDERPTPMSPTIELFLTRQQVTLFRMHESTLTADYAHDGGLNFAHRS